MAFQVREAQRVYRNEIPEDPGYNLQDPVQQHGLLRLALEGVPGLSAAIVEQPAPAPLEQRVSVLFNPPGHRLEAIREPTYIPLGDEKALAMHEILDGLMAIHREVRVPVVVDDSTPALIREMVAEPLFARTWVSKWHAFFETIGGDRNAQKVAIAQFLFHMIVPIYKRSAEQDRGRLEKYAKACYTIVGRLFPEENVKQLIREAQILLTEAERVRKIYMRYMAFDAAEQTAFREIVHAANLRLHEGYTKIRRSLEAEFRRHRDHDIRIREVALEISQVPLARRELVALVSESEEISIEEIKIPEPVPLEDPQKLLFEIAVMLDQGRDVGGELAEGAFVQRQERLIQMRETAIQIRTLQAHMEREGREIHEDLILAGRESLELNQRLLQRRQQTLEECRQAQVELLAAIDADHGRVVDYQQQLESIRLRLNTFEPQLRS